MQNEWYEIGVLSFIFFVLLTLRLLGWLCKKTAFIISFYFPIYFKTVCCTIGSHCTTYWAWTPGSAILYIKLTYIKTKFISYDHVTRKEFDFFHQLISDQLRKYAIKHNNRKSVYYFISCTMFLTSYWYIN